jgi:hypothetical protein
VDALWKGHALLYPGGVTATGGPPVPSSAVDPPAPLPRPHGPHLRSTLAGTAVGVAVAAGLVVAGPLRLPERRDREDATAGFLVAWERSRRGTFVVRSVFGRRQPDGATLSSPTELVQRPPDRLVRRFGGITGTIGGREVSCTGDAGAYRCTPAAAPPAGGPPGTDPSGRPAGTDAFEDAVRQELDTFRSYVTPPAEGDRPLYRVVRAADAGCFALVQQLPYTGAPYGTDAQLCFDDATGALRSLRRRFDNGVVETEEAGSISGQVTLADLGTGDVADPGGETGPPTTGG